MPGRVVGHVLFSRNLLDAPRQLVEVQVLSPLAVRPDHQGKGAGTMVYGQTFWDHDAVGRRDPEPVEESAASSPTGEEPT